MQSLFKIHYCQPKLKFRPVALDTAAEQPDIASPRWSKCTVPVMFLPYWYVVLTNYHHPYGSSGNERDLASNNSQICIYALGACKWVPNGFSFRHSTFKLYQDVHTGRSWACQIAFCYE